MSKPFVVKSVTGKWIVGMDGKQTYPFQYWWVAVSFAIYAFKYPSVMAERL